MEIKTRIRTRKRIRRIRKGRTKKNSRSDPDLKSNMFDLGNCAIAGTFVL